MRFSERIGAVTPKLELQIGYIDEDLRNSLWNCYYFFFVEPVNTDYINKSSFYHFYRSLWNEFFKLPMDDLDYHLPTMVAFIRRNFFKWDWYEVYDFLEFICSSEDLVDQSEFQDHCNLVLNTELSGYRFISGLLTPITNTEELNEVEEAVSRTSENSLSVVNTHLRTAISKLSDKNNPDYRNSIKESISAVESMCKRISGDSKDSLSDSLRKLRSIVPIHPSLEQGFMKIYGYTSDGDGIRHGMYEESKTDFTDAKFILIASCSFVNYLIGKCGSAGIKI